MSTQQLLRDRLLEDQKVADGAYLVGVIQLKRMQEESPILVLL